MTSFNDDEKFILLSKQAVGYLFKTSTVNEISDAIRATRREKRVLELKVITKMMEKLSQRDESIFHKELINLESEILILISEGKSNQEISYELFNYVENC